LASIASGKWVLNKSYLDASQKEKKFVQVWTCFLISTICVLYKTGFQIQLQLLLMSLVLL
jgi:hypothetical protein